MTNSHDSQSVGEVLSAVAATTADVGPEVSRTVKQPSGPPQGFGSGVNAYLNHYVGVADAKAGGFLAAALTVGAAVVALRPVSWWGNAFYWVAVITLSGAGTAASIAIFPRLPRSANRGLVFWEEIRVWPNTAEYQRALGAVNLQDVEFEYAAQNYVVSEVLHRKHLWVRRAVFLFVLGTAAGLASYLITHHG